jgi:hypothetical protein
MVQTGAICCKPLRQYESSCSGGFGLLSEGSPLLKERVMLGVGVRGVAPARVQIPLSVNSRFAVRLVRCC